jgi:hypothetical protein
MSDQDADGSINAPADGAIKTGLRAHIARVTTYLAVSFALTALVAEATSVSPP